MPKIRSNASSAYLAKKKYASERKRDDNLFPDDEDRSSKRRGGYGSRTKEAEEREREDRDSRDYREGRSEREREVDERESTRRGREESSRDDRRLQKEGRGRDRDSSTRDSQSLAEIRYQLNKIYNFMKDFKDDLTNKEMDAWDAICREADAEEFSLNKRRRSSGKYRDDDDDYDRRDVRSRRSSSKGDGDMRRHKGQDRYESNGLVKGDVKILLNVVDDERLDFRGSLGSDLFYITDELHMGNYSRDYERSFLNLLRELDAIRLDNSSSRDDIDYLMDIYLPKDRRKGKDGRYDDDYDDRDFRSRRSSNSKRKSFRRDDDDYDYDRRGSSIGRSGRGGYDRDDDDYDRRDVRRGKSSSTRNLRRGKSDRYDDYDDRDYDRRDSRRPSGRSGRYSGGGRNDDRYSGRNGGTQRRGKSGFDFKYLDEVLYDLEQLPGFIDDLSDFGYEAYSYLVSAIRTEDDSSIAEDATVFMEELFAYGMDYALTDDEYDFLVNEASRYQSVANRYIGRQQSYDNINYRQAPVRRVAVHTQPTRVKRVPISKNADMNIVREDRTFPSSRKLPNENDAQVRPSRSYGKYAGRQSIETGNDYVFEPKRQNQKYVGRNKASNNIARR